MNSCLVFETNRLDQGLILELWNKGVLWDKLLGVYFMPLTNVQYMAGAGPGNWLHVDQELETRNGQTVGTCKPTGHSLLVDVRFELPFGKSKREFMLGNERSKTKIAYLKESAFFFRFCATNFFNSNCHSVNSPVHFDLLANAKHT
jgi:hypothetical protein